VARTRLVLASILVLGASVGLAVSTADTPADTASRFDARDCTSGYTEGGVVDYDGSESSDTVAQARARGEGAMLRAEVRSSRRALTVDSRDRKVWTYYATTGESVAEIVLERAGNGWRPFSGQQCAPDGAASIQEGAVAPAKQTP
jgi:hypothetical protein